MLKGDKLKFQRGAAAKTESEDRYTGRENRHHDRDGTAGSRKSPASLSPAEILSKDRQRSNEFRFGARRRARLLISNWRSSGKDGHDNTYSARVHTFGNGGQQVDGEYE